MLHASRCLGNIHSNVLLATQVRSWQQAGKLEEVTIEEREAHKSRLRVRSLTGSEIGLLLPRGTVIAEGDVFALEEEERGLLIHLCLQEVMVLTPRRPADPVEQLRWAVRLGHVLGNQHWPIAIVGECVFVPVLLDRAVMETVLRTHHLMDHFGIHYEQRSWPHEAGIS